MSETEKLKDEIDRLWSRTLLMFIFECVLLAKILMLIYEIGQQEELIGKLINRL